MLRVVLWTVLAVIALVAVMPSLYLLLWAFFGSETVGILERVPSLKWFAEVFANPEWQTSIAYSTVLAFVVSLVSVLALGIHFYCMRYSSALLEITAYAATIVPVILPQVIYALALRVLGGKVGLPELLLVFAGHLVFVLPLQFFVLDAGQETVPTELLYAGSTLGASHLTNITSNYFPLMTRPVIIAFLVGFFFSFDELVIATFVIDSPMVTVTRRLWDQVPRSMVPSPAVIGCSLLGASAFLMLLVLAASQRNRKKCLY